MPLLILLYALNTIYLASFASPTMFYFANVGLHIVLGAGLTVAWAIRAVRWHRTSNGQPSRGLVILGWTAALILVAGIGFGLLITVVGAAGRWRWLLPAHIACSLTGAVPLLTIGALALVRHGSARERRLATAACAIAVLAAIAAPVAATRLSARMKATNVIRNPSIVPVSMNEEGRGSASPFFPSSGDTNVHRIIPANFFMTSASCGRCHKDIYDQWNSSAHHFSSFNNQWYRKSIEYMQDTVGTKPSRWCAGCHDHAVFFNGRFDRPIKEQIDTPEAQAGLACTSCHSITQVRSTMGQGDFEIEYPPLHDLAASDHPILRFIHDQLTYIDPQPHREIFLKPFHREQTPEFCSSCHKVHLDVPVNSYRWFRGFNDYDNWQASGVSGEGARSFYYPKKSSKCADCHMPLVDSNDPAAKNGKVRSHRFAAANTALPFVNGDAVQLKAVQDFLRDGQISVDIFGIVRSTETDAAAAGRSQASTEPRTASTFAVGEESMNFGAAQNFIAPAADVIAPLGKVDAAVRRGESVRVEVVVRTRKVGHFFPGGTVDAFDVWVELEAVDEHGNPINKRNAWSARSVAYVRLIPPGAADTIHYRLQIPEDAGDKIYLKAKVNYRKFAWWNTQWAYAGVRDPADANPSVTASHDDGKWVFTGNTANVSGPLKAIPDIPTTIMAQNEAVVRVLPRAAAEPGIKPVMDPSVRERWNDYGIGLLLQGDIKNAEATFLKVTQMEPSYADGWVNVGRARVQEGNMAGAEDVLRKALAVDPELAKTHFFLATALKSLGRYDEAIEHLRTARAKYPRDRVVLNQLGRVLFLKRQYKEAIGAFAGVLTIDPEDLQAHYNLMLCYQGLGEAAAASRERALYERFKADESSQSITGPYRQLHAEDNNERQQIHEHTTAALQPPAKYAPARVGGH